MQRDNFIYSPLISIIIPVYNGEEFLKEAIDSALGQTYPNIEVIVVDDGSTDKTEKIVQAYGHKLYYLKKQNAGVSSALNLGIKQAKGKYVSWLSHDDVYALNKIEKQVQLLQTVDLNEREKAIIFSNYQVIDQYSQLIETCYIEKAHDVRKFSCHLYPVMKGLVYGCTLLIPKQCFFETAFFDEALLNSQDYDLWFKLFPKYPIYFQSDHLLNSRSHPGQGTHSQAALDESNALWIKMLQTISDQDKIAIDGSIDNFYVQNFMQMKRVGYNLAAEFSKKKLGMIMQLKAEILLFQQWFWGKIKPFLRKILRVLLILP